MWIRARLGRAVNRVKSYSSLDVAQQCVSSYPSYDEIINRSRTKPEDFWAEAAEGIEWIRKPKIILDNSTSPYNRWFPDGQLNLSHAMLDANISQGRGNQTALIYDSGYENIIRKFTYNELLAKVETVAGAMRASGIKKGDFVLVYMPMVPEAIFAMIACARIGAVHAVVFGGFAAAELKKRIEASRPSLLVTSSCGLEPGKVVDYKNLVDRALEESSHKVPKVVVLQRKAQPVPAQRMIRGRDVEWDDFVNTGSPVREGVVMASSDTSYVLYTSGTTGQPKGVVRDVGGHAVALKWSMANIFGVHPAETWFAASDIGWVVGHSYIVYGPLLNGNTTVLFEGKSVMTPDASAYWRLLAQHQVKSFFTAPTALRAIKKEDPELRLMSKYRVGMNSVRSMFVAGERADPDTVEWAMKKLGLPVIDHWWQTETGWPITGPAHPLSNWKVKPGSAGLANPGYHVEVLDDSGSVVTSRGRSGNLVVKLPLPPGTLMGVYQNHDRFLNSYFTRFPGYYDTSDSGFIDDDGYIHVMARSDDVMNVAGHRLSSGAIEEAAATHALVAECCAVAMPDAMKGSVPLVLIVNKKQAAGSQPVDLALQEKQIVQLVRERVGPIASPKRVVVVDRLPKTRSGKILRVSIRQILHHLEMMKDPSYKITFEQAVPMPATIEDPTVLLTIYSTLQNDKLI